MDGYTGSSVLLAESYLNTTGAACQTFNRLQPSVRLMTVDIGLDRNVGGIDRMARAILAVAAFGIGIWGLAAGPLVVGVAGVIAGAVFTFNVVTQYCITNAMLGIETCDGAEENV